MKTINLILLFVFLVLSGFSQLNMQRQVDGILITEDGKNVLFYQTVPKNFEGKYERCHYIHPLWAEDGTILTEDFPADHLHHRGIFWAWHQVWIGDERIGDPWEIKDFDQEIIELEFIKKAKEIVQIKSEVEWSSALWKKDGVKIPYIKENALIEIHPLHGNYRLIDFEIRLLARAENLKIGGSEDVKGYSGFSVRMKLPDDILFEGKSGKVEPLVTAVESPGFINMSGSILKENKQGGIIMVDHLDNPDFPQKWILRAKNSMQNAAWPGNQLVPVSTKNPLVLKYSLIVYSGKMNQTKIQKIIHKR